MGQTGAIRKQTGKAFRAAIFRPVLTCELFMAKLITTPMELTDKAIRAVFVTWGFGIAN